MTAAGQKLINLTDTFNAFAEHAINDFPALKGELVIYHAPTNELYGYLRPSEKEALLKIAEHATSQTEDLVYAVALALHPDAGGYGHTVINYFEETKSPDRMQQILRHELGHLVAPRGAFSGSYGYNLRECIADVFCVLYRAEDTATLQKRIEDTSFARAWGLIGGSDTLHFSSTVLQKLKKLSATYNIPEMKLSPIQTANLAYRLCHMHAPAPASLAKAAEAFQPVRAALENPEGGSESLMACGLIMLNEANAGKDSDLVFNAAKVFLEPYLNKREDIIGCSKESFSFFDEETWDPLREAIKAHADVEEMETREQRLAQEARDLLIFGCFSTDSHLRITPAVYESHARRNERAMNAYKAIRYFQETGEHLPNSPTQKLDGEKLAALNKDQIISLACVLADHKRHFRNPLRKIPAAT